MYEFEKNLNANKKKLKENNDDDDDQMLVKVLSLSKKQKDGTDTLKDINFGIKEKEIFGLVGPSKSGKSTLFKIITGKLSNT